MCPLRPRRRCRERAPAHPARGGSRWWARAVICLLIVAASLGVGVSPAHAMWSILAVDPESGRVAIATAACTTDVVELGELVPGTGAAVSQSAFDPSILSRAAALVGAGQPPEEIIADVTRPVFDPQASTRQHAVVSASAPGATHTGGEAAGLAEGLVAEVRGLRVAVIGDRLTRPEVAAEILEAFDAEIGSVELGDRLMRALEAGSAAGGDVDCNTRTYSQTARAAAIRIAEPDDRPDQPSVELVALASEGGPNPLLELRARYDEWRTENLAPCPDCDLDALEVPPGGTAGEGELSSFELLIGLGAAVIFMVLWLRRRFVRRAGPSPLDPAGPVDPPI